MPNNEMDYSLIHRTPDGNGKILVTTPGSPDKGSWETEAELKTYVNQDVVIDINTLNTRVTNIEETLMGENEVTVQYPTDSTYPSLMPNKIPARALKYAEVPRFRGKSRAWNQFGKAKTVSSFCTRVSDTELTISYSTSGTAYAQASEAFSTVLGHKYLVYIKGDSTCKVRTSQEGIMPYINDVANGYLGVRDGDGGNSSYLSLVSTDTSGSGTVRFLVRDLTLILSDWSTSDITTANIPLMVQQIPDLLKYNAYDAGSLVDTVVSGVKSVGVNIFDEEMELGAIDNDGIPIPASTKIRSKNYIPLVANTEYMIHRDTPNMLYVFLYDANKNFVRTVQRYTDDSSDSKFTTASNEVYMKFYITGTSYNNDIQISRINGSVSTINTTYHPYKTDTLALPSPVTLRSAGSVTEVLTLETGKKTRPIGRVDLGTLNWTYDGTYKMFYAIQADAKGVYDNLVANIICGELLAVSTNTIVADLTLDKLVSINPNKAIIVRNLAYTDAALFKTAMSGIYINYELATPLSDEQVCDPIPDNFLEVEGGGTVETIQTQSPIIDNCLDVTYDIIPQ